MLQCTVHEGFSSPASQRLGQSKHACNASLSTHDLLLLLLLLLLALELVLQCQKVALHEHA